MATVPDLATGRGTTDTRIRSAVEEQAYSRVFTGAAAANDIAVPAGTVAIWANGGGTFTCDGVTLITEVAGLLPVVPSVISSTVGLVFCSNR